MSETDYNQIITEIFEDLEVNITTAKTYLKVSLGREFNTGAVDGHSSAVRALKSLEELKSMWTESVTVSNENTQAARLLQIITQESVKDDIKKYKHLIEQYRKGVPYRVAVSSLLDGEVDSEVDPEDDHEAILNHIEREEAGLV